MFIVFYTTINVILRIVGRPFNGDIELTSEVEVIIIYFVIAEGVISNTHIKIELFTKLPILEHINNIVAFAVGVYISVQAFIMAGSAARFDSQTLVLGMPRAPFILVSGIGFALFSLAIISVEAKLIIAYQAKKQEMLEAGKGNIS
jgi:TRAP-type C4-dicarboxylate transport system permease small subunit